MYRNRKNKPWIDGKMKIVDKRVHSPVAKVSGIYLLGHSVFGEERAAGQVIASSLHESLTPSTRLFLNGGQAVEEGEELVFDRHLALVESLTPSANPTAQTVVPPTQPSRVILVWQIVSTFLYLAAIQIEAI